MCDVTEEPLSPSGLMMMPEVVHRAEGKAIRSEACDRWRYGPPSLIFVVGTHPDVAIDPILQPSAGSHIYHYIMLIRFRSERVSVRKVFPSPPHLELGVRREILEVTPCVEGSAPNGYLAKIGWWFQSKVDVVGF